MSLSFGFAALVVDGTRSIAAERLSITTLGQSIDALWPNLSPTIQGDLQGWGTLALRHLLSAVLFPLPTALLAAAVGVVLILAGRPRRAAVGVLTR
ncbi:PetM family of cytochrome b6f complex subunit 7 [Lichenihabitans psoromatis]|uniref:PetM family of cytochrome b6f complex subunit 7 n=1 Tax=Lichenihabitans psoromatis TaxID=2528642 RepID=UPI001036D195|nr:PetM family of cytochrome b6f complex subunit 7 [Lichenihabitans psoromatis]